MDELIRLRHSIRLLSARPAFSLTVIGILALGIAGNAAVFSLFDGLFLRPLSFAEPERLVDLDETAPQWNLVHVGVSNPDLWQWKNYNSTFEGMAFFRSPRYNLSIGNTIERVQAAQVTQNMLDVLQLKPLLGRNFTAAEDKPGAAEVVLLSYSLWQRVFNSNLHVLGELVKLDDEPYTIIGVLPRGAVFPDRAELWVPLAADPNVNSGYYVNGIGRLKPGVSIAKAQADLLRIHKAMITGGHATNRITSPIVTSLRERYLGNLTMVGRALLGGVAIVLLIACVNIAALMMVHGSARSRELAVRAALGASGGRIVAQLLSETIILAAIGGILGIVIADAGLHGMLPLISDKLPDWISFSLDWRFAAFSLTITCAAAVLFGLVPAFQTCRIDVLGSLQAGMRATSTRGQRILLNAFVVSEIGLALMLSISAGLLLQTFRQIMQVDPGFQPENVLAFVVRISEASYPKPEQKIAYYDRLLERLQVLPGVKAAGATSSPPLGGQWGGVFEAEDGRTYNPNGDNPTVAQIAVTPGYLRAIGMSVLQGRVLGQQDGEPNPRPVAMVNETFAKYFWNGERPVGRHIRRIGANDWLEVVGVLRDEKHYGLDHDTLPSVYLPYPTAMSTALRGDERAFQEMSIILRTSGDPTWFIDPARETVRQLDSDVPTYGVQTMMQKLDQSLWTRRAYSWLFGAFALVAVLLSTAGIYGTVSYRVGQRTREIGVRMALGADRNQVVGEVLLAGMRIVSFGLVVGLAGALATARILQSLLFDIDSRDPKTYATVVLGLTGIALLATFVPARRAAKVDPMVALRYE
jgi:putative ABC transport system permease protein